VQRPEPRRTGRRNAPAYGPQPYDPQPPRPNSYEPNPPDPSPDGSYWYEPSPDPYGTAPWPEQGSNGPVNAGPGPDAGRRQRGRGRIRRFFRLRTVRVILALIAVLLCWVGFSVGQALAAARRRLDSRQAGEWARDHYLGPVVTFGEWISYNPPRPAASRASPGRPVRRDTRQDVQAHARVRAERPRQARLTRPAIRLSGEGAWRVLETVRGNPAIFGTFLRPSAVYSSYVAGLVSMDQRLVKFRLRRAPKTLARATGRPRRGSRRAPARACWPRSTAGSSWTRRAWRLLPQRARTKGRPGQRGGVGGLLPRRHHQDRFLGASCG